MISLAFPVVILKTYLKLFPCFILAEVVIYMAAYSNHAVRLSLRDWRRLICSCDSAEKV